MARRQCRPRVPQVAPRASRARALVRYRQPPLPHRYRHAQRTWSALRPPPATRCSGPPTLRARRSDDRRRPRGTAAPDAGARLCVGTADRGLDRHRQSGVAIRSRGGQRCRVGFALVALWLLALGAAAAVSTRGGMRPWYASWHCAQLPRSLASACWRRSRPWIACTARGPACMGCVDRACLGSRAHAAVVAVRSARTADRRRKPRRALRGPAAG